MKNLLTSLLLLLLTLTPHDIAAQGKAGSVDIFMGVDFNYRDIWFNNRVYDVLVNLTPGA